MAGEAQRDAEYAALQASVERAREAVEAARQRGAGPTELRLLTERLRAMAAQLRCWHEHQRSG